jgi:hypothetical protein
MEKARRIQNDQHAYVKYYNPSQHLQSLFSSKAEVFSISIFKKAQTFWHQNFQIV